MSGRGDDAQLPPGRPGIPPRWTSSAKSGVGTAAGGRNRVWFTVSHGIVNEVFYPMPDQANTRDLGLLVADGADFFSEEKRDAEHRIAPLAPGVPGYRLVNTCREGRYRIEKTVLTDADWDALVQLVRFEPLRGRLKDYGLYVLLAPHLGNRGYGNSGRAGEYKGLKMLFAEGHGTALALACSAPFDAMGCGYVGASDGWQDVSRHRRMTCLYPSAPDGNIALTGRIDLEACGGSFRLALAFGRDEAEAGQRARAALMRDEQETVKAYVAGWEQYHSKCLDLGPSADGVGDLYRTSVAVIKTHAATRFPGAIIASLSVPWGSDKGDDDLGGYHLVWSRDLVESACALLAAGDAEGARETLFYLICTQEADGHWPQNMWVNGSAYWPGVQMDETAFPVLLADALRRCRSLGELDAWPMVRGAAAYIVRNGPVTQQDRWEEDGGFSPFTLAVEIAALLAAADFAELAGEPGAARYLRETADTWNDHVERWTYCEGTELARQSGVRGYYVRIAPPETADASSPRRGFVPIKNRPPDESELPAAQIVSPDALALVRFGLREASDPRVAGTVEVIDALLRTETATGPVWHRYDLDGYGEHEDGRPFDGTGVGRGWPLLAGERGHYELAAGNYAEAERLLGVMSAQASEGGMIPEQVWDSADLPRLELSNGRPSGSAMPLVWAHAEYVKLLRSLRDGKVFDLPPQTAERYLVRRTRSPFAFWRFNHKCSSMPRGKTLRVETLAPAVIHWSADAWRHAHDTPTRDTGLGIHHADLSTDALPAGSTLRFTFFWPEAGRWEGEDFALEVEAP